MQTEVREAVEVDRTPLFDNAPFLRLRAGDKLVKAKKVNEGGKSTGDPDRIYYYLRSSGLHYHLWTTEEDGKLLLASAFHGAHYCVLFEWEPTLANAKVLRQLLPNEYASSLTISQFEAIRAAIAVEFPNARRATYGPELSEDRSVAIPRHTFFEFQGLAFDRFWNHVFKYTVRIGPTVFSITGHTLLQGPKYVDRSEFEFIESHAPNSGGGRPDPEAAKLRRAEYEEMIKFQKLVTDAIGPPTH